MTPDGRYLIIRVWPGVAHEKAIFYQDLATPGSTVVELVTGFDANHTFVGNNGPLFYFLTDLSASRSRVIAVDITQPNRTNWRELIPEQLDILQAVSYQGFYFVASYMHHACHQLVIFDTSGELVRQVVLPSVGSVVELISRYNDPEIFLPIY